MSRTLVVGFDGALLSLTERWMADGRMPTLESLFGDGAYGAMRSVYPYNSAVAWTSLVTGVNPGRHGIFDFLLPGRDSYALRVATREDRLVPALWNHVAAAGGRAGVVNIPMTFPAERIDGVVVSGMDAPRLEDRAVQPPAELERVRRSGYRIASAAGDAAKKGDWERAEQELVQTLVARSGYVQELARPRDLDLLVVNFEATDGAHHYFWQHHDPSHPRHDPVLADRWGDAIGRVYAATDRELGRLVDAYAPDTVFVVSDHGGGPANDWVLFVNDWLASEGLLQLVPGRSSTVARRLYGRARERLPQPLRRGLRPWFGRTVDRAKGSALYGDVDWSRSTAYAQMQAGIRLNLAGREPAGIVAEADRQDVLAGVRERAEALVLPTGERVFLAAIDAGQVYRGDAAGGWDLLLERRPDIHIRSRNTTSHPGHLLQLSDLDTYLPSGLHTPLGMVAAAGAGIATAGRVAESDIHQVAPSVLAVMGISAPDLDGEPMGFVTRKLGSSGTSLPGGSGGGTEFTPEEEQAVLERLKALGYVD
jgi:predicted AlkP superfamily phosphohydrolase/phosphomutase